VWSPDGKYIAAHHEPLAGNPSDEIWVYPLSPDVSSAGEPTKIVLSGATYHILAGWSTGGELGVFLESETHTAIYTVAASGGRAVQVTPEGGGPYYPRWSPDGARIYFRWFFAENDRDRLRDWLSGHEATAYVPAGGGKPVEVPPVQSERPLGITIPGGGHSVSPDGKRIVVSAAQEPWNPKEGLDIWTIPLNGGHATRLTNDASGEGYPCWSPCGRWVAFVDRYTESEDRGYNVICITPAEGGEIRRVSSETDSVDGGAIAFSPDGVWIAFFSNGAIKAIPVEGGEPKVLVAEVKSGRHSQLAYSPDGSKIAHNATGRIWTTLLGGGEPEELQTGLPEGARLSDLSWSPDGEKIAFVGTFGGDSEFWLIEDFLPKVVAETAK
jgi:Tol biopolymer transport system component